jgi:hypothetical protein
MHEKAARDWCAWEAAHVAIRPGQKPPARYEDLRFRLAFARIVTHYWRHKCSIDDVDLIGGALKLAAIPAVLVHGRLKAALRRSRDVPASGADGGRLSDVRPGQHNPDSSEDPWGGGLPTLHGGASALTGPTLSGTLVDTTGCTNDGSKPIRGQCIRGGGLN